MQQLDGKQFEELISLLRRQLSDSDLLTRILLTSDREEWGGYSKHLEIDGVLTHVITKADARFQVVELVQVIIKHFADPKTGEPTSLRLVDWLDANQATLEEKKLRAAPLLDADRIVDPDESRLMPGVAFEEIWNALDEAFDADSLKQMLRTRIGPRVVKTLAWSKPSRDIAFDILEQSDREGWRIALVREAHRYVPGNAALAAVYQKYGLQPGVDLQQSGASLANDVSGTVAGLERTVRARLPMIDPEVWRARFAETENWVCRIECDGKALGTGFLIAADRILTNYHVMEKVLAGEVEPERIRCRFGFKILANGAIDRGREVRLHESDWRGPSSDCTSGERAGRPETGLPSEGQLDFAAVRLAEPIGSQPVDSGAPAGAPPRRWLQFPAEFPELTPGDPLLILQHPEGAPLKLAMDLNSVLGANANNTRVRYATNTLPGSSGSPCFTLDWTPVLLHHYGDPSYHAAEFNQGIPLRLIAAKL